MVYLTSHGPTKSCESGNWPNVTVTVTNWDEKALAVSKSDDEETLEAPRLSCQEEQMSSSQSEKQSGSSSESETAERHSSLSLAGGNRLQVPSRLPPRLPHVAQLPLATGLKSAKGPIALSSTNRDIQLLDAGELLQSCCEKYKKVPFNLYSVLLSEHSHTSKEKAIIC